MNENVISLSMTAPHSRDWSNQELAEFYRVENSLIRAGLSVETDRGLSDEGDPWFIFCHAETGDVIIHFARFDGSYAVASPAFGHCKRGADFRSLIKALIETHPLAITKAIDDVRISIHPAALMVAVVMIYFFKLAQTQAFASQFGPGEAQTNSAAGTGHDAAMKSGSVMVEDRYSNMLLTAIALASTWTASGAPDSTLFADPGTTDVVQPRVIIPSSEHTDAGVNFLDNSALAFEHLGQPADHAQSVLGVLSVDDVVVAPREKWDQFHTLFEAPNIVAFDSAPFDMKPMSSHESNTANVAPHSADDSIGNLARLPVISAALSAKGAMGIAIPPASVNTPESLHAIDNVLGSQVSIHQILDLSGDQPQLVLHLVEHEGVTSAPQVAAHSGTTGTPDQTGYATFLQTGSLPSTAAVSENSVSSVNSPAKLAAFDNALNSFASTHPDFRVLEFQKDVVVFDSHLNSGNIDHANVAIWTFADGSHVTLVGVAPQVTPHE
jgi:hypothetical protein